MQKTGLICNNFSGINRSSAIFDSSLITASDSQNVELFSTETNSGVGIRTSSGNRAVSEALPEDEKWQGEEKRGRVSLKSLKVR